MYLGPSVILYPGESYQFNPQTNCTNISWFPPAGLTDPYIFNPVATPEISTIYVATGSTADGCTITDSLSITVNTEAVFGVPNAFTPGTGANNLFKVLKRGDATLKYFRVYDRWGILVFETTDIDKGWDGMYKSVPQPLGVYVYDIEAVTNGGRVFHKTGNVTLLR
jgi:gliding motility-associated-like protein